MEILKKFSEILEKRHDYARQWKKDRGGKILGHFCSYVPEEIIYAAGILPVRVLGNQDPHSSESPHIYNWYCPFSRDCLYQGLEGRYDYLDGIVGAHSCVHMRGVFDSWEKHVPISYSHHVYVPYLVQSPHARKCLVEELRQFKLSLEDWLGREISSEDLDRAIEVYNTNRDLLSRIYALRKSSPPAISGVEATEIVLTSMMMDKDEHNVMLRQVLDLVSERQQVDKPGIRLMVLGTENSDVELLRLMESLGTNVVTDDYCTGTSYFKGQVEPGSDRISAIAERYLSKPPCPEKDMGERRRPAHLRELAREYGVQGAVITQQQFCDRLGWDIPIIQSTLAEMGIPTLQLECDVRNPVGQFRTRIEAFIETLS